MKLRTLARLALKFIKDDTFLFDTQARRIEAYRQLHNMIKGKKSNIFLPDPIIEFHIGVYVPSFDYPIIPVDSNGNPIIWKENDEFLIPGDGTHRFIGIGLTGEKYSLSFMDSLADFGDLPIKVDKYTNAKRAAYALVCSMTKVVTKLGTPIKIAHDLIVDEFEKHDDIKKFEKDQHHLYIKWLSEWISVYGKNPETHVRGLKVEEK